MNKARSIKVIFISFISSIILYCAIMYYRFTINTEKMVTVPWLIESNQIKNSGEEDALIQEASIEEVLPNGEHGWHLDAHTIRYFEQTGKILAQDANCVLFNNRAPCAEIEAQQVIIDTTTKNLIIKGSLKATYNDITLIGTEFFYMFQQQILFSKQPITCSQEELVIIAQEGSFDIQKKEAQLKHVKTIIKLS